MKQLNEFEKDFLEKYDNGHIFTDKEMCEMKQNLTICKIKTLHSEMNDIYNYLVLIFIVGNRFFKTTQRQDTRNGKLGTFLHLPVEVEIKIKKTVINQNKNLETQIPTNTYDNVENPSHYTQGRLYEPKDVIRDWGLNFNLGSAVKYISRAGRKNDKIEDLKKAKRFLEFEIEYLERENEG